VYILYRQSLRLVKNNSTAITVLNIFLGWTFLGWLGSLIWAIASPKKGDYRSPTQIIEVNNIIPRNLNNNSFKQDKFNESNDSSNDVPTLAEWRKDNPHRGINYYYAKYGNRS